MLDRFESENVGHMSELPRDGPLERSVAVLRDVGAASHPPVPGMRNHDPLIRWSSGMRIANGASAFMVVGVVADFVSHHWWWSIVTLAASIAMLAGVVTTRFEVASQSGSPLDPAGHAV